MNRTRISLLCVVALLLCVAHSALATTIWEPKNDWTVVFQHERYGIRGDDEWSQVIFRDYYFGMPFSTPVAASVMVSTIIALASLLVIGVKRTSPK